MQQTQKDLIVESRGSITEIRFRDHRLVDAAHLAQVGQQLLTLAADAPQKSRFILSFDTVEALSSAALGIIISFDDEVRRKYGQLHLCNLKEDLLKLFTLTKLNKRLHIFDDVAAAKSAFAG